MRASIVPLSLALIACFLAPADLSAQRSGDLRADVRDLVAGAPPATAGALASIAGPRARPADGRSTPALIGAGLLGGAVGVVAGGYLGALITDDEAGDLDFLSGALYGAAIGEGLLLPLGVHLADDGDGSYPTAALASLALAGAGLLVLEAVHYDAPGAPIVLVAVPVAQIAAAIAIERATD